MKWLFVNEVAKLNNVTERAIRERVYNDDFGSQNEGYRFVKGKGRGGKQIQIAMESLPEAVQARYRGEKPPTEDIQQYTGKQRDEANFRALVVEEYHHFGLSPDEYIAMFNEENPPEDAITKSQLFRWQRRYKEGSFAGLIDKRGGYNRGQTSIAEAAWDCFYALYMTQQKRSIRLCYDVTKMKYPDIPSVSCFERQVKLIPQYAILYFREGKKAFNDALPCMERSKRDISSNDIWFSDHHLCDVFVKSEDGQKVIRPWLTVFFDARSNKVISFVVRNADPNATVVKKCFRLGVEQYGIPNEVYFDNGKDYRSKKAFGRDYPMSLVNQLSVGMIYAHPYHGQAKTVERFFGTFTNRFSRRFQTYTGCNAKARPECMQKPNDKIIAQAPTFKDFVEKLAAYIQEYNATPSSGRDMDGNCPNQVYLENLTVKRVVRDVDALRLLCGNSEERVVNKNGVSFKNNSFFHEALLSHIGERVIVTYDPENLEKLAVFDMDNRAICMAHAKIKTPFRHTTEQDYIRAEKEKKAARAIIKKHIPKRNMEIHEIIAHNQLMERQHEEAETASVMESITPAAARNSEILKRTDGAVRRREEESVSAILLQEYMKQNHA